VADSVPPATRELNLRAFDKRYEFGVKKEAPVGQRSKDHCPATSSSSADLDT
jgi:hypothetical protein